MRQLQIESTPSIQRSCLANGENATGRAGVLVVSADVSQNAVALLRTPEVVPRSTFAVRKQVGTEIEHLVVHGRPQTMVHLISESAIPIFR
jgi:hypothetical protein